jgi:hypothetical protein
MSEKSRRTILLDMVLPGQVRWPRRKRPLGLSRTSEMRYFPPQLGSSGECRFVLGVYETGKTMRSTTRSGDSGFRRPLSFCTILLFASCLSAHAKPTFTEFDPPGSVVTQPESIKSGVITGFYQDSNYLAHGFIRAPDGSFTIFDAVGATNGTGGESINDSGTVAGVYYDSNDYAHSLMRTPDGTITTFDPPGAVASAAFGISDKGAITGYYANSAGTYHGYVRAPNGRITTFDGASGASGTEAFSINHSGAITGVYADSNQAVHGFLRARNGTITSFDVPGAMGTAGQSINDRGVIAGYYGETNGNAGFVRAADGTITTFDPAQGGGDYVSSIDKQGRITGDYDTGMAHGFVRSPDGAITTFDPPGSTETIAFSIDAGAVVGPYVDSNHVQHGYVRSR